MKKSLLHPSQHRIIGILFPVASSEVCHDHSSTSAILLVILFNLHLSPVISIWSFCLLINFPRLCLTKVHRHENVDGLVNYFQSYRSYFVNPRQPLNLGSFYVHTLMQVGQ